ncbi:hypothetical protein [Kitasatospora sp. NPDC092286]|uniref:hypothetical protein n=1 Tax=Kitasatospora sp. NPDC092286 TaxID=3364087 RepID=UPI0037FC9866
MNPHVPSGSVEAVLLADGWHDVKEGTFSTGAFTTGPFDIPQTGRRRGRSAMKRPAPAGFTFVTPDGERISGPLTSVLAVRSPAPAPPPPAELPQWCGLCNQGQPTGNPAERWEESDRGGIMRCPRCHPQGGVTTEPVTRKWCGRCEHTAARWIRWRQESNGTTAFQPIPCPRCHPAPEKLLAAVPKARGPYEQCVALLAINHSDADDLT